MKLHNLRRRASGVTVAAVFTLVVGACGSDTASTADTSAAPVATSESLAPVASAVDTTPAAETTVGVADTAAADTVAGGTDPTAEVDTSAGVKAAQWGDNVTITYGDGTFQFVSNGIPNHELSDQYLVPGGAFTPPVDESEVSAFDAAEVVIETPLDVTIPTKPVYSDTVTDTSLGMIGVMISGAQMFNDYEDQARSFIAVNDNFSIDGVPFVDSCNGHPLAINAGAGNYHYHGIPYCITDVIDTAGSHSKILGVLKDGFPLYGPQDVDGTKVTGDDLDECNGHFGPTPEFPAGIYHYHSKEDVSPYTPNCYHGVVDSSGDTGGGQGAPPGGGQGGPPDFTDAAATLGVTVDELTAALGQPPFDLEAAATKLGVTAAELKAALPPPPGG
jgi:YHYH protein